MTRHKSRGLSFVLALSLALPTAPGVAPPLAPLAEVCAASGLRGVAGDAAPAPQDGDSHHNHCALCSGGSPPLAPAPQWPAGVAQAEFGAPAAPPGASTRGLEPWRGAMARGPPA